MSDLPHGAGTEEKALSARATSREWIALAVLALPTLLVSLDIGALYLALPSLTTDLAVSATQQLWVTDIYGFLLASFLVTMGNLGDRVGRRRLLLIGAGMFAGTSAVAAFSSTPEMLIIGRAGMGIAGATLMPSTLALISTIFQDDKQRARAISIWVSTMMLGSALGPVVGGVLLTAFWWGAVFLLAIPVAVAIFAVGPSYLPEVRADHPPAVDWVSAVLSVAGLLPLVYGLKSLALRGDLAGGIAALVVGVVLLVVLGRRQLRLDNPLVDLRLFNRPAFSATVAGMLLVAASMAGTFLVVSQFVQSVLGLPPAVAGLWLLPMGIAVALGAQLAPMLAERMGTRAAIAHGLLLSVAGFSLIAVAGLIGSAGVALALIEVGGVLLHLGAGPLFTLGAGLVVSSAPPERAGAAASFSEVSNNLGATLGLAVFGTAASAVYTQRLADSVVIAGSGLPESATATVASTVDAAGRLPVERTAPIIEVAHSAFAAGLVVAAAAAGLTVLLITVIVARYLRAKPTHCLPAPARSPQRRSGCG